MPTRYTCFLTEDVYWALNFASHLGQRALYVLCQPLRWRLDLIHIWLFLAQWLAYLQYSINIWTELIWHKLPHTNEGKNHFLWWWVKEILGSNHAKVKVESLLKTSFFFISYEWNSLHFIWRNVLLDSVSGQIRTLGELLLTFKLSNEWGIAHCGVRSDMVYNSQPESPSKEIT